ncbi:Mannose-P-dolichol utilization defect 1 protein like protein [Tritrichomonas foetus]|uniref:Solute carrier family 66 member 3 n=1 Tax=Tritrichomonas foetus TaxID=1144522 RepID=A0A1J4JUP5_9EUKA|nr:Mannose-P-dolichol utilization defect 1 protein like protein [Tritrichomonas foetus]|eukprot:OHT02865.1 Mannose-P-dolichol utilization defect 1 protein like protein [Tritrichomonas foetus]
MKFINDICSSLLNEYCCKSFISEWNFFDRECVSLAFSRGIGIGVIFFSSIIKIPQIFQILRYNNGFGISMTAMYIEITVNTLSFSYHLQNKYPFTTYGETVFIFIQNLIIAFLVSHYDRHYPFLLFDSIIIIEFSLIFAVLRNAISPSFMSFLWRLNLPLSLSYKCAQIVKTWKIGCKGELSTISSFMKALGSLGRVFTTLREINDGTILFLYFVNFSLNAFIFVQCIMYPKKAAYTRI